jgi:hypothetical protein
MQFILYSCQCVDFTAAMSVTATAARVSVTIHYLYASIMLIYNVVLTKLVNLNFLVLMLFLHCSFNFLGALSTIYRCKVKFTLEQAMKAQRGSRGIALLFL